MVEATRSQHSERPWWYLAPLAVLFAASLLAPSGPDPNFDTEEARSQFGMHMLIYYAIVGGGMLAAIGMVWRKVLAHHSPQISRLAIITGVLGVVAWILICQLKWESAAIEGLGFQKYLPARMGFNPFRHFDSLWMLSLFLAARFVVLAIAVPIAEEWFLRGFLARYLDGGEQWPKIGLREISFQTLVAIVIFCVLSHPREALAAVVWFSMVNWLMKKTGNLWDCVAAHMLTNFLLGIYILTFDAWHLW